MDTTETAKAYRRRADVREAERRLRYEELRGVARDVAVELRDRFGAGVRTYLFGSLLDLDRFRSDSDIDIAVEGLGPAAYWEAWRAVEEIAGERTVDLVRLETAASPLRKAVRLEGELLP